MSDSMNDLIFIIIIIIIITTLFITETAKNINKIYDLYSSLTINIAIY